MSNLNFSIQTLVTTEGGSLKSVTPNKDGVYEGMPVAVMGIPSRNEAFYTPNSTMRAISDPKCRFYKNLTEGNLEGEWGHPELPADVKEAVRRTLRIDRKMMSHYFTRIFTKDSDCGQYVVIYADVVAAGPYGKFLTESMEDPKRNTAFSLRSITTKPRRLPNGVSSKDIISLVTFDAVDGPGFEQASKRFMANEGLGLQLVDEDILDFSIESIEQDGEFAKVVGFETAQCQELLDIFEAQTVILTKEATIRGTYDSAKNAIVTPEGDSLSIFHSIF